MPLVGVGAWPLPNCRPSPTPRRALNPGLILARRANVQGISVGSMQMFEAMNRAITARGIKPVIDKVFGFDEVHAAYKHMASGAHFGKIVIHVA